MFLFLDLDLHLYTTWIDFTAELIAGVQELSEIFVQCRSSISFTRQIYMYIQSNNPEPAVADPGFHRRIKSGSRIADVLTPASGILSCSIIPLAVVDFLEEGVPTYYLVIFFRKLHENEEILGRGGRQSREMVEIRRNCRKSSVTGQIA